MMSRFAVQPPFSVHGVQILASDSDQERAQKLARITLDETQQLVGVLDPDGTLLECNRSSLERGGLRREEVVGKPFWETAWWSGSAQAQADLRAAIGRAAHGEVIRYDVEIRAPSGGAGHELRVMDFTLLPIKDEKGRVVYLLPEGRDITQKKAEERELAQGNAQMRSALERIRKLDEAKTRFFSNISHEIRTPLTLMLAPLEELEKDPQLTAEVRDKLRLVQHHCVLMLKLANSLREFSRIEGGRTAASFETVDLGSLTRDLVNTFRAAIERGGLALYFECDYLPGEISVDRAMWEKIVVNLMSNAFKYTLRGSIRVALKMQGRYITLSVGDTGIGIPQDELPLLFERFHRGNDAQPRSAEGAGVGLALVKELAALHGGDVEAQSTPGAGSLFTVRIPFSKDRSLRHHLPETEPANTDRAGLPAVLPWGGRGGSQAHADERARRQCRIVIADDDPETRAYLASLLASDYTVASYGTGADALEAVRASPPDLVIADATMPAVDGVTLTATVRSEPALQDCHVILISTRADEDSAIEAFEAGVDDFLVKPFPARKLLARVYSLMRLRRQRSAAAEESRQRATQFATLFADAPIGIYLVDADFRLRALNPQALRTFQGIPDLIGRDFDEVIHILWPNPMADEVTEHFWHTLETGEPYYAPLFTEERLDRASMESYEWQLHRMPLPDGRYGVACYFRLVSR